MPETTIDAFSYSLWFGQAGLAIGLLGIFGAGWSGVRRLLDGKAFGPTVGRMWLHATPWIAVGFFIYFNPYLVFAPVYGIDQAVITSKIATVFWMFAGVEIFTACLYFFLLAASQRIHNQFGLGTRLTA
jgi:hypothetical protein